jgi:hypothetical protein
LYEFLEAKEAEKRWAQTCNEVILQLGKGSGKDFMSAISCAYIVYLLLCLKDPARYYDKPSGDTIDILNIAQNAAQASNVFFANVSRLIQRPRGSRAGTRPRAAARSLPRPTRLISTRTSPCTPVTPSERRGRATTSSWSSWTRLTVSPTSRPPGVMGKTAAGIYDMYRASVDSRFPEFGKILALSFPRYKGSWIQTRYEQIIASQAHVQRREILKLDPDLPDGFEGNEIPVEWDEDHIEAYQYPNMFAP